MPFLSLAGHKAEGPRLGAVAHWASGPQLEAPKLMPGLLPKAGEKLSVFVLKMALRPWKFLIFFKKLSSGN